MNCVRAVKAIFKPSNTVYFPASYFKNVATWLQANGVECVIYGGNKDTLYFYTKSETLFEKAMDELPALLLLPLEVE